MDKVDFVCPPFPKTVSIMGTEWTIEILNYKDDWYFEDALAYGYCSNPEKRLVLCNPSTYPGNEKENQRFLENEMKHVLRHEIVHAFMYESGLADSAFSPSRPWAKNEEMIDWIAMQGHKIHETWEKCECLPEIKKEK